MRLLTLDSNVVASRPGTNAVNVGGGEVWNFGTYVDGTNNFSKWLTLQRAPQLGSGGFALETVKEVQIITNQFSAEFGGHAAGVSSMITKSGTNEVNGSAFVMIRPGDWDAKPPLARATEGEGAVQPAAVRRRRRRADVARQGVLLRQLRTAARAQRGRRSPRPRPPAGGADAGGRAPGPVPRRRAVHRQVVAGGALQHGALEQGQRERRPEPAGHRVHLGQQRRHGPRHLHDASGPERMLNEVRGAVLALHRSSRGQVRRRGDRPHRLLDQRRLRPGHVGGAARDDLRHRRTPCRSGPAPTPSRRAGRSPTTSPSSCSRRCRTASIASRARRTWRPTRSSTHQAFALVPEARLMYPKAYVLTSFVQDDWRVRNNLTLEPRPALRHRVHQGRARLAGPGRQEQRRPARSGLPGIRRASRSGPSAAAPAGSRSSIRSSRS